MATLLLPSVGAGANGNIGLFFDDRGYSCDMQIPCGCKGRLYVFGLLQGASQTGITGAEYKIRTGRDSNPDPGWVFIETFDPTAVVLGAAMNPVDPYYHGVNVAWPACQQGDGYKVLIETVELWNVGCAGELDLLVVKHDQASNEFFQCPYFVLCDAPVYTKVCLGYTTTCPNPNPPYPDNATCSTSGEAWVNDPYRKCCLSCPEVPADCTVDVTPETWSAVKGLYRP